MTPTWITINTYETNNLFRQQVNHLCLYFLKLSNCVSTAFTTLIESDGSVPDNTASRALVKLSTSSININTNESPYSNTSFICWNIDITNEPLYNYNNKTLVVTLFLLFAVGNLNFYFRKIFGQQIMTIYFNEFKKIVLLA